MELSLDAIGSARAVLIAGPTASGKSALALRLAREAIDRGLLAWVINADAMQVYDGLRVLTARPTETDERRIPHRLYGHVSPGTRYSVGQWLTDVGPVLQEAESASALAIAVGGTGLYFKALTEGLAAVPDIPVEVRDLWSDRMQQQGAGALHALLTGRDPDSAAVIRPSDPHRILRALEVLDATGRPLSVWQKMPPVPPLLSASELAAFVIEVDRTTLHRRIEERFDRMVNGGALEEVRALLARGLDGNLPAMKAIGVREFAAVLSGEVPLAAGVERARAETRRYAKRQGTWFRNQVPDWQRIRT